MLDANNQRLIVTRFMRDHSTKHISRTKSNSFVDIVNLYPNTYNKIHQDGSRIRSRSCEDVYPNSEPDHAKYPKCRDYPFGDLPRSYHELQTFKSLDNLVQHRAVSGNRICTLCQHKSSSNPIALNENSIIKSRASSSDSLSDRNFQPQHSDEENLPGARKRRGRPTVTDDSDDIFEHSASLTHSCSDFDSYYSEGENDNVRKGCVSAVTSLLDGVTKLNVSGKQSNSSLSHEHNITLDADLENVDADQDKSNPAYIPRAGRYYMHDHRTVEKDIVVVKKRESNRRWQHDKFNYYDQTPRSTREIIWRYGYDIRKENLCSNSCKTESIVVGNVPTTTYDLVEAIEVHSPVLQSSKETHSGFGNTSYNNHNRKSLPENSRKPVTNTSFKYNSYSRSTKSNYFGQNLPTRKSKVTEGFQTEVPPKFFNDCSESGMTMHRRYPTKDVNSMCTSNTRHSYSNSQQDLNCPYRTPNCSLRKRNNGDLPKPTVKNFQNMRRKQSVTLTSVYARNKICKPSVRNSSHVHENAKPGERVPKRYSTVRQSVSNVESSVDKELPSRQTPPPVNTKESCNPVEVESAVAAKLSTTEKVHETITQLPESTADHKSKDLNNKRVYTELIDISKFGQQKMDSQSANLGLHSVPVTHFQPIVEFNTRMPAEYSPVNPQLQTIYFPGIFQHDPQYHPPSTMMSNYVLPSAQQAHIHHLYGNEIQNVNLSVPVATTLCFDPVSCNVTNDPSQAYVMNMGVNAMEPHWNGEKGPVPNRRFSKKPLEVIDPRDGTRVDKVPPFETQ
ncbi:Protein CASC3 [Schistosoma japonicum]|nr:Protein CASC3 [Schistosoma japonicum]